MGCQSRSSPFQLGANSHVVGKSDLPLLVTNDGETELGAGDLINVLDPATVALNCVCAQADELGVPLGELGLELGESTELGGADGGVVLGVGEEDDPVVANELVEVDGTTGGLSLEVGGGAAEAEGLRTVGHFGGCVVVGELAVKASLVSCCIEAGTIRCWGRSRCHLQLRLQLQGRRKVGL